MKEYLVDFVAKETKDISQPRTVLKCPQCNFEYFHPVSISVYCKNEKTSISSTGITITNEENNTRGVTIALEYACESGYHGVITFQFYKDWQRYIIMNSPRILHGILFGVTESINVLNNWRVHQSFFSCS